MCCFPGGVLGSRSSYYVCVRKKIVYFCDGFVDLLVSLQPLAVVLRLLALSAQLAARSGSSHFAV